MAAGIYIQARRNKRPGRYVAAAGDQVQDIDLADFVKQNALRGAPGAAGTGSGSYVFIQAVAASVWTIVHNLGFYPNVTVVDSSNRVVVGEGEYININTIQLTFVGGFSGTAYLS